MKLPSLQQTALTATIGLLGWVLLQVVDLRQQQAAETAEDQLRNQVTDVVNDIDKRLAVIETHLEWIRMTSGGGMAPAFDNIEDLIDSMPEPVPAPVIPDAPPNAPPDFPKYDLREPKKAS